MNTFDAPDADFLDRKIRICLEGWERTAAILADDTRLLAPRLVMRIAHAVTSVEVDGIRPFVDATHVGLDGCGHLRTIQTPARCTEVWNRSDRNYAAATSADLAVSADLALLVKIGHTAPRGVVAFSDASH